MEFVYAFLLLLTIGIVIFLLDRLGLWLEDRGWIYYRKKTGECVIRDRQRVA